MILSTRTKESIKTALAMVIAYGIALSMNWERPYWAGFAVSFTSLYTAGQSLNKATLRMLGTLLAFVVSLIVIALFVQERWWFMVVLSIWIGFCTYMMCASKHSYFWFVAGFVCAVISFDAGPNPVNAFHIATLRVQETGLGILVYSLVCILLWPTSTRSELESSTRDLIVTQRKLYSSYLRTMINHDTDDEIHAIRMQTVQTRNRLNQALIAARTDTYEVKELYGQWLLFQDQSTDLLETLARWHASLKEVENLDLNLLLPNLDALTNDIEPRFALIEGMLAGDAPEWTPQAIDLSFNKDAIHPLTHFHRAAFMVTWIQLQHIEELTRSLFDTVCSLKGFGPSIPESESAKKHTPWSGLLPDIDHIIAAVSAMTGLWLAYLLWIYIEIPGGTGFVGTMGAMTMVVATTPQLRPSSLIPTIVAAITFAGMLYLFIMPQLSSFVGLGLMLFVVTFAICYLFAAPRQGVIRSISLAMLLSTLGVSNQQSYSVLSVPTSILMMTLIFSLLALTAYIPVSRQPEHAFLRLLGRFFHSCDYLMTTMRWDLTYKPTRLDHWKKAFHSREIMTIPDKLVSWRSGIDTKTTSPDQLQALTTHLLALTFRIQELLKAPRTPPTEFLMHEMLPDMRAWLQDIRETFQRMQYGETTASTDAMRDRLTTTLEHLDVRIKETLNKVATNEKISDLDAQRFYCLLGAYRGLSEATIEYAGIAEGINWSRWRETRF